MTALTFIATSVDGYIARLNGGLDWLPHFRPGEDYGYGEFIATVDVIVMGRQSFEAVLGFPEWPYREKPVVVLSSRSIAIPAELADKVSHSSGDPQVLVDQLEGRGYRHAYVDGGRTIQAFLRAGLLQRLVVTRVPVLLGSGIPLFGTLDHDIVLRHVRTKAFSDGLVQTEYEIDRGEPTA